MRAKFGLCKELLGEIRWDYDLTGKGAEENRPVFRTSLQRAQELCVPCAGKQAEEAGSQQDGARTC